MCRVDASRLYKKIMYMTHTHTDVFMLPGLIYVQYITYEDHTHFGLLATFQCHYLICSFGNCLGEMMTQGLKLPRGFGTHSIMDIGWDQAWMMTYVWIV